MKQTIKVKRFLLLYSSYSDIDYELFTDCLGIYETREGAEQAEIKSKEEDEIGDEGMESITRDYCIKEMPVTITLDIDDDREDFTDDEFFNLCANKSIEEIQVMTNYTLQRQAIRYWLSRHLMNYPDENPLEFGDKISLFINAQFSDDKYPVHAVSMTEGEGYINFWSTSFGDTPVDMDRLTNKDLISFIIELEKIYF